MKRIFVLIVTLVLCFCLVTALTACKEDTTQPITENKEDTTQPITENKEDTTQPITEKAEALEYWRTHYTAGSFGIQNDANPFVELEFSTGDVIRLELYPSKAPASVDNFLQYVNSGFYEGIAFHRIIQNFMVQTGAFEPNHGYLFYKESTYPAIRGEFASNGFTQNDVKHEKGVISMARTKDPNSATSQFFLCSANSLSVQALNGMYAAFGKVIDEESMAVIEKFEKIETVTTYLVYGTTGYESEDVPTQFITITKTTAYK